MRAYPRHAHLSLDSLALYDVLADKFVDGLRAAPLRLLLFNDMPRTLFDLKIRAQALESSHGAAFFKPTDTVSMAPSGTKSNVASANDSQPQPKSGNGGKNGKRRGRKVASNNATSTTAAANVTAANSGERVCYNCQQPGHMARDCVKPRSNSGNNSAKNLPKCSRCGRSGHLTAKCWQSHHVDGSKLSDNGVRQTTDTAQKNSAKNNLAAENSAAAWR